MGIYLPNMEMPKSCGFCPIRYESDLGDACFLDTPFIEIATEYQKRPDNCVLVFVPPHGDLIDVEAFLATQRAIYCENCERRKGMKNGKMRFVYDVGDAPCRACGIGNILDALEDAPTIIPASEEGVKTEKDTEPWLCLSCRHYPPSSTDGKPCSQCNPSEVWYSCYDPTEEGE